MQSFVYFGKNGITSTKYLPNSPLSAPSWPNLKL